MAVDLGAIADQWAEARGVTLVEDPALLQQPQQAAPAAQQPEANAYYPPQAFQQQQGFVPQQPQAPMRQTADGSLIRQDCELVWGGWQGDPNARVVLRHSSGQVLFDGYFGQLAQAHIPGVWVPASMTGAQANGNGLQGSSEGGGALRAFGIVAATLAAGGLGYGLTRWWKNRKKEDEAEA